MTSADTLVASHLPQQLARLIDLQEHYIRHLLDNFPDYARPDRSALALENYRQSISFCRRSGHCHPREILRALQQIDPRNRPFFSGNNWYNYTCHIALYRQVHFLRIAHFRLNFVLSPSQHAPTQH